MRSASASRGCSTSCTTPTAARPSRSTWSARRAPAHERAPARGSRSRSARRSCASPGAPPARPNLRGSSAAARVRASAFTVSITAACWSTAAAASSTSAIARLPPLPLSPAVSRRVARAARRRHVREGLHGDEERHGLASLAPFPPALAAHLCHLALMRILPAVADSDFDAFAAGITELQRTIGEYFAPVQGGVFASPAVARAGGRRGRPDRRHRTDVVGPDRLRVRCERKRSRARARRRARREPRHARRRVRGRHWPQSRRDMARGRSGEVRHRRRLRCCMSFRMSSRMRRRTRCRTARATSHEPRARGAHRLALPAGRQPERDEPTPMPEATERPISCTCSRPRRR